MTKPHSLLVFSLLLGTLWSCGDKPTAVEETAATANTSERAAAKEVQSGNEPPVASAGQDQTVNVGATVILNGGRSYDPDGDRLTYRWRGPTDTNLSSTSRPRVTFTATTPGTFRFVLIVNDGQVDSAPDEVVVTVRPANRAPVANASSDQTVAAGTRVTLDGRGSSDPDRNRLTYRWTAPSGITLNNRQAARPSFQASAPGTYTFTLVVNDGRLNSTPDLVVVTVEDLPFDKAVVEFGPGSGGYVALYLEVSMKGKAAERIRVNPRGIPPFIRRDGRTDKEWVPPTSFSTDLRDVYPPGDIQEIRLVVEPGEYGDTGADKWSSGPVIFNSITFKYVYTDRTTTITEKKDVTLRAGESIRIDK